MSPRATGNSNSVTARSRTSRVRTTEVREELPFEVFNHQCYCCEGEASSPSFTRLRQWCDEGERNQLHHQGLIHQHATHDGRETPPAAERALCGWKVIISEAKVLQKDTHSRKNTRLLHQDGAKPAFRSQHFLFLCEIPALSLPLWNNSAFSALLLSSNGCPSVITLLRSFILLEDKGWSGKLLCSCTVCWVWTKD